MTVDRPFDAVPIALSLGSNIGDAAGLFRDALKKIGDAGLTDMKASSLYQTAPVDCAPGTPDFTNAAATGLWTGTPEQLLDVCKKLETDAGRPPIHDRNASRPLDMDIILFGDFILESPTLTIPHPEAADRLFVLIPLAEIAGDWPVPGCGKSVNEILDGSIGNPEYKTILTTRRPMPDTIPSTAT